VLVNKAWLHIAPFIELWVIKSQMDIADLKVKIKYLVQLHKIKRIKSQKDKLVKTKELVNSLDKRLAMSSGVMSFSTHHW